MELLTTPGGLRFRAWSRSLSKRDGADRRLACWLAGSLCLGSDTYTQTDGVRAESLFPEPHGLCPWIGPTKQGRSVRPGNTRRAWRNASASTGCSTGGGGLHTMLAYKAPQVVAADPQHTSRTSAACGLADAASRRSGGTCMCSACGQRRSLRQAPLHPILATSACRTIRLRPESDGESRHTTWCGAWGHRDGAAWTAAISHVILMPLGSITFRSPACHSLAVMSHHLRGQRAVRASIPGQVSGGRLSNEEPSIHFPPRIRRSARTGTLPAQTSQGIQHACRCR